MANKTNLEQALDSIKRIGSFSEGEKIALVKGLRQALFPMNWSLSGVQDDDILQYNATTNLWENTPHTMSLAALSDTAISSPTEDQALVWNGSAWVNQNQLVQSVNGDTGVVVINIDDLTPTTTKGDILAEDGTNVVRLGVGTNGQALLADSAEATGLKWGDIATDVEGTDVLSTGEAGGIKFLREDGDGTCSWQSIPGGGDALTANPLSQFAATTSAQLRGVITNETGTGSLVFADNATLTNPALGTPASGDLTNCINVQLEGTALKSTGEVGGAKFLREDGDGTCSWQNVPAAGNPEGTDVVSTGVTAGYVLTADGDNTSSWQPVSAGGGTFVSLTDTPSSYSGTAGQWLRVNGTADGIEFVSSSPVTQVTGTSPIVSSGGTTPAISIPAATSSVNGYMTTTQVTKLNSVDSNADVTTTALPDAMDDLSVATSISTADEFLIVDSTDNKGKQVTWTTLESFLDNYFSALGHTHTGSTISSLDASDTTTGTFSISRIPTGTTSSTVSLGDHTHSQYAPIASPTFTGTVTAPTFNATSAREKKNILGDAESIYVDGLDKLKPVIYTLKDDPSGMPQLGLIADEVQSIYPELTQFDENGKATGLDYSRLVIPLLLKVRKLEEQLNA